MTVLRDQLLAGTAVALRGSVTAPVRDAIATMGAAIEGDAPSVLVYDATGAFAGGGRGGLRTAVDEGWEAIADVAIPWASNDAGSGKIVLIAPPPAAGPFVIAAAAALENLVRTLSVEWARYRVTASVIAPGAESTGAEIAELVCFLSSAAGDYFSGCRFDLR